MNKGRGVGNFLRGIILVVVGIVFLAIGCIDKFSGETTKNDFNYMASSEFEKGIYVSGEIYYAMDYFEEEETTRDGKKTISGRTYLIPVAYDEDTEKYLGVFVPSSNFDVLDQITNDTFDYLYEEIDNMDSTPTLQIRGKLKSYGTDEMGFLYDYMMVYLDTNSKEKCDEYIIPYYIDYKASNTSGFNILIGGVMLGVGLILIIIFIVSVNGKKRSKNDDIHVSYNDSYGSSDYGNMNNSSNYNNSSDDYTYNNQYNDNFSSDYTYDNNQTNNENTTNEENAESKFKLK